MKTENKTPDLIIEQLLLGELPKDYSDSKKQTLLNDPYIIKRMEELKQSNKKILETYPSNIITENINNIIQKQKSDKNIIELDSSNTAHEKGKFPYVIYSLSAAAVLFIALTFALNINTIFHNNGLEETRIKGESVLYIYKQINSNVEELDDNSIVHENDRLQLRYSTNKEYGIIFSIDGNGYITIHLPENILSENL